LFKKTDWLMKPVLITLFGGYVFYAFLPILQSFFDPQEFISFLNPLAMKMPVGQYMAESWSWTNNEGVLIGFFRPLISATFMVEYPLFGLNPIGYKLVNLGMHLLCAFFLAKFVMQLSGRKWLAAFAGMLFTLHPGTVVATGMIVSRHDILACLFSILAISSTYSLSRSSKATWKAYLPALFMFLAVNSKEVGMMNLIALPIMYFFWPGRLRCRRNTIVFVSSLIFVEIIYLVARELVFGNIGGYGNYTELSAVPMHIFILITQATGGFFVKFKLIKVILYLSLGGIIINFIRIKFSNWREVAVAILVVGAYSSQSVIGDVATHYVYTSAAFTVLFLIYFVGKIDIQAKGWKQVQKGIAILILIGAGFITRKESIVFNEIYVNCERVFTSLEDISHSLPREDGSVCFVQVSRSTSIEAEMKNVPLYMRSIDTESGCNFVLVHEALEEEDTPTLVWSEDRIILR